MSKHKRLGEVMVEGHVITEQLLQMALERQQGSGKRLGQVLEEMGVIAEGDIATMLARQFGIKAVEGFVNYHFSRETLALVSPEEALEKGIFPLKRVARTLYLAMVNPLDMATQEALSFRVDLEVVPCVTTSSDIQAAVHRHYDEIADVGDGDWWMVLLVDPQETTRIATAAALEKDGYHVVQAANGADALKQACLLQPHLVVSEHDLGGMDVFDLKRLLAERVRGRSVPIFVFSSYVSPEEEVNLLDAGFVDYVCRPLVAERLRARVRRVLKLLYPGSEK